MIPHLFELKGDFYIKFGVLLMTGFWAEREALDLLSDIP